MIDRLTHLKLYMDEFPVVVLTGPRQVGKTTLVRNVANGLGANAVYLDMELNSDRQKLADLEAYFSLFRSKTIIIDEAQMLPAIYSALRPEVDADRRPGRFLLTGSANPAMVKGIAESLAGRAAYLELTPLNYAEIASQFTLEQHWFRGGYPLALLARTHEAFHRWMAQYVDSFIYRDLQLFFGQVLSEHIVRNLWHMLAAQQGSLLNTESLARSLGVTSPTVKRYIQLLEGAYLVRMLQPWNTNVGKRLTRSPKVYLRDSGLLHHLTGIASPEQLPGNIIVGGSWEGYVVEEIIRALPAGLQPFFYRTQNGAEIDLLLIKNSKPLFSIEIKHSRAPLPTKGFYSAIEDVATTQNLVVYTGNDVYPGKNGLLFCPLPYVLQLVAGA